MKRTIERAEMLYGRLDGAQRKWVAEEVATSPFDPQLWLDERGTSGDMAEIYIRCECGEASPLMRATIHLVSARDCLVSRLTMLMRPRSSRRLPCRPARTARRP